MNFESNSQIGTNWQPMGLRPRESNATVEEGDSIINYFKKESKSFYSVLLNNRNSLVHLDELYSVCKDSINAYLSHAQLYRIIYIGDSSKKLQINNLVSRINKVETENLRKGTSDDLTDLTNSILGFPLCQEKIALMCRLIIATNVSEVSQASVYREFFKLSATADSIKDSYEKAQAYLIIGDFFQGVAGYFSIEAYYKAQAYVFSSYKDSILKNSQQGLIYNKIATLFPGTMSGIEQSIRKQCSYYLTASEYYQQAKDSLNSEISYIKNLENCAQLSLPNVDYPKSDNALKLIQADALHYLKQFYITNKIHGDGINVKKCMLLKVIGDVLLNNKHYDEANKFYISSLAGLTAELSIEDISSIINGVSITYAFLGNKDLALKYSNFPLVIGDKLNLLLMPSEGFVTKAKVYMIFKNYDSVLYYTNQATNKLISPSGNISFSGRPLYLEAIKLKINAFNFLGSDSAFFYKKEYEKIYALQMNYLTDLLIEENTIMPEVVSSIRLRELAKEKLENEEIRDLNGEISDRNWWLLAGLIALLLAILALVYFYRKNIKQSRVIKNNLEQEIAFKNLTTHDIKKLITDIPKVLKKRIEKIKSLDGEAKSHIQHIKNISSYVSLIFKSSKEPTNTIQDQLNLAEIYAQTFKQTSLPDNYQIKILNKIKDEFVLNKLQAPSLLLNNFIKNSIEHGTADTKKNSIEIIVSCEIVKDGYKIFIDDNGCGIKYAKLNGGTQGNGINLAKETIAVYNSSRKDFMISFSDKSIIDKQDNNLGKGTIVTLFFNKVKNGN